MEAPKQPNQESTPLTPQERQMLAEIEERLNREAPALSRSLAGRRWSLLTSALFAPAAFWAALVVAGTMLIGVGLVVNAVLLAFTGFVMLLCGVHQLTLHPSAGRLVSGTRRVFGVSGSQRSGPHPDG